MKNKKILNVEIKETAPESRVLRFIGSDATEDRSQEVMTVEGWELDNYVKNPVILFGHDYSNPPVGKAINVIVGEKGLEFEVEFASKETYPFADTVFRLVKEGFMRAVSVGFIPKENNYDPKTGKNYITKKELLELSIVPVPCNPNALALAFEKGMFSEDEVAQIKSFEIGEKVGRTISAKNEKLLVNAKEAMQSAISALEAVMNIQEDAQNPEEEKQIKNLYDNILTVKDAVCGCQKQGHKSLSDSIESTIKTISQGGSK